MKKESREESLTKSRRRRGGPIGESNRKLVLPAGFEEDPAFDYRWANEDGTRLHNLTVADDWDFVETEQGNTGSKVSHVAGVTKEGTPLKAYLLRKKKEYTKEDRAAKHRAIDEREGKISRPLEGGELSGSGYVPSGGISLETKSSL